LTACASEIVRSPTEIVTDAATAKRVIELTSSTSIKLSTGYSKAVDAGSKWQQVGALSTGQVFRSVGDVFTIEGANRHEAYLVIRESSLIGFYLPGERAYSALTEPFPLQFKSSN
jgi:hypothetical protein